MRATTAHSQPHHIAVFELRHSALRSGTRRNSIASYGMRAVMRLIDTAASYSHQVDLDQQLPSLAILLAQIASERETMNAHAESLDGKAGVVLGFAGVLVGLGATAQVVVSGTVIFQVGLAVAVVAAVLAAWAFLPRRYPVLEVERLRQSNLTASEEDTRLELLDTQIEMVKEAATLVRQKGWRVRAAVGCLAIAAALVVAGILTAVGGRLHA